MAKRPASSAWRATYTQRCLSTSFLLLVALSFCLAACGDATATTVPAVATPAPAATTAPVAATTAPAVATTAPAAMTGDPNLKGTVVFWHAYNTDSPENDTLIKTVIPAFNKLYPNVTVNPQVIPSDQLRQKLLTGIGGDILPDVVRLDIQNVPEFADMGALAKLDSQPGFADLKTAVYPGPLSTTAWKSSYYGLPLDTNTKVLFYNKALFDAAGIAAPPKTMDDFAADAQKLTKSGQQWGWALGGTAPWSTLPFFWSLGGEITDPTITKATGYLNSPDSIAALQFIVNLRKNGAIADTVIGGGIGSWEGLTGGKYGMFDEGPWIYPSFDKQYPNFKLTAVPIPAGKGGSVSVVGGEDIVMLDKSQNKDAAWAFMRYMLSSDAQLAFAKVGQMPVLQSASDSDVVKGIPYYATYLQQLQTAKARTPHPAWPKMDDIMKNAFDAAIRGDKTAKAVLDDAAQQIDALLAKTS